MAVSDQKIRARLQFLEWEARARPRRHALRLAALVALGYLYPALLLLVTFGLAVALLALAPVALDDWGGQAVILYVAALLAVLVLTAAVLRTFFVTVPAPIGLELRRDQAPALWALLDDAGRATAAARIHHVQLNEWLNASVAQRRRFGFWGTRTNYLTLGIPLLIALTPAQLRAVVSHELGHLRGRHNSFAAWIYRVQRTWESLATPFESAGKLRLITMGWFVRWYGPYFATSTLALRRRHEYEADRHAAETDGPAATADVLTAIEFAGYRMEKDFWPAVFRGAAREALPPADVFAPAARFFAAPANPDTLRRWWERERRTRTPITHEHPRLADRLANIGFPDRLAGEPDPRLAAGLDPADSALPLLGPDADKLCAIANASWKTLAIARWRFEHALATKSAEPDGPDAPAEAPAKPGDREWEDLQPRAHFAEPDEAIGLLREFLARFPDHAGAHFALGTLFLDRDDDRAAVSHLEAAAKSGSEYIGPSLDMLLDYYRAQGRDADADPIRARLDAHGRALLSARKERLTVGRRDRFLPHDLSPRQLLKIRRTLTLFPQVRTAWLARKEVRLFTDKSSYVLALDRRAHLLDENRRRSDKHLVASLQAQIDLPCAVVILRWSSRRLRSRLLTACPTPVFASND